jgi:hypothetical protein
MITPLWAHPIRPGGGRGGGLSWNKIGACEVLTPQRRIHSNANQWCCGWGERIAKDYYNATLFWKCWEFIHSPLMFLGLPYTLGFDPCGHFYHIAYKLCATYCIINTFQQTKNRRNSPSWLFKEHTIYYFINIHLLFHAAERKYLNNSTNN